MLDNSLIGADEVCSRSRMIGALKVRGRKYGKDSPSWYAKMAFTGKITQHEVDICDTDTLAAMLQVN